MELDKDFIPYTEALTLKELGFDEPCFGYYIGGDWDHDEHDMTLQFEIDFSKGNYLLDDKKCTAPTFSQAFRWFRERYKSKFILSEDYYWIIGIGQTKAKSYEEAELECLKKLIEVVKSGNQEAKN